jgi:hypothetical protein
MGVEDRRHAGLQTTVASPDPPVGSLGAFIFRLPLFIEGFKVKVIDGVGLRPGNEVCQETSCILRRWVRCSDAVAIRGPTGFCNENRFGYKEIYSMIRR